METSYEPMIGAPMRHATPVKHTRQRQRESQQMLSNDQSAVSSYAQAPIPNQHSKVHPRRHWTACLVSLTLLAACGGGGGGGDNKVTAAFAPSKDLANICVNPTESAEKQGVLDNEKAWVRSFVDERYLWYKDVPAVDAARYTKVEDYYTALLTKAKDSTGLRDLDRYSYSQTYTAYNQRSSGVSVDYGIAWARASSYPPRSWTVSDVEPKSPAGLAGVRRGDKLASVDGVDFIFGNADPLNKALFPENQDVHKFEFDRAGTKVSFQFSAGASYETTPVRQAKVINYNGKKIAYVFFDAFVAKAQDDLSRTFQDFANQGATDLVIDLRYNPGGLLILSAQLAYMIAGTKSESKNFYQLIYNDKRPNDTANGITRFESRYIDWVAQVYTNTKLPTLNLNKVTVLVTENSASASEALINGLRGIDVEVNLIGQTTYGKPYGSNPTTNCGRTYSMIEFKGANAKGFGDYGAGFAPTCTVGDDITREFGDPSEGMLAAGLYYAANGKCVSSASSRLATMQTPKLIYDRKPAQTIWTPIRNQ